MSPVASIAIVDDDEVYRARLGRAFERRGFRTFSASDLLAAFARASQESPPPIDFAVPSLARAEWEHINRVLTDCGGNISQAARVLRIQRRSLQRKLAKHPVPR